MGCSSSSQPEGQSLSNKPAGNKPAGNKPAGNKAKADMKKTTENGNTHAVHVLNMNSLADIQLEQIATVVDNDYKMGQPLPQSPIPKPPVSHGCLYGFMNSKWPIRNYCPLEVSINAHHGGMAALAQVSCDYGGGNTAQLFFIRTGFDSNLLHYHILGQNHKGHFGPSTSFLSEEGGRLMADCLFGNNHIALMSNNSCYGNLSHGLCLEGGENADDNVVLPVKMEPKVDFGGALMVLCSGYQADGSFISAVYLLRPCSKESGDKLVNPKLISGDDKWTWTVGDDSFLVGSGISKTWYGIYHNRAEKIDPTQNTAAEARAGHAQTADGSTETTLISHIDHSGLALVMCSASSSTEDGTAAALYSLTISDSSVEAKCIYGNTGTNFDGKSHDLWTFELREETVIVKGPENPCRYGYISNYNKATEQVVHLGCLATGEDTPLDGSIDVNKEGVLGWINKKSDIVVFVNELPVYKIEQESLLEKDGKWPFFVKWQPEDLTPGLHLVKVFAQRKHTKDGSLVDLVVPGSPHPLIIQPEGVLFAINCGAPMYQALNDIVYEDEHKYYGNFTYDYSFGTKSRAKGGVKNLAQVPQLIPGTLDGQLYTRMRTTGTEAEDERQLVYKIEDMPNKKLSVRMHFPSKKVGHIVMNGSDISSKIRKEVEKSGSNLPGGGGYQAEITATPSGGTLEFVMNNQEICAFVVFDPKVFVEKVKSNEQLQNEAEEKQKLADLSQPLARSMTLKARKIVGWSQNLLQNASAEAGSLTHWNVSGDMRVHDGGYGTEKSFITSHMWCEKYQEVDLTQYFSPEYLDTGPEIQISEWYREGVGGGGFYKFKACILTEDGTEIDTYATDQIGTIYRDSKWEQTVASFKNYGPGVRRAYLSSGGKDDKYWAGHYGTIMSTCVIRVQRESKAPDDDKFEDVNEADEKAKSTIREKLVSKLVSDNQDLMEELLQESVVPQVDTTFQKQTEVVRPIGIRKRQKKREIRIFVSSTFRDFKEEREQLIKKTFREINGMCADRGVFFTYIDLRWGITENQTTSGETIAICLQEIDRCRPYFICMMGERFGWSQNKDKPDELLNASFDFAIDNFPSLGWVDRYRFGASVTQLEILHGVLNDVEACKDRSFFYLRNPVQETESPETLKVMKSESDWHNERQMKLRKRLQDTNGIHVRTYTKPEEACEVIKKDLAWCVDQDFPKGTELTHLEREREAHLAFAEARRRVYIGREAYFNTIDEKIGEHLAAPLVILGESGSGKSALVANWVGRFEDKQTDTFVFVHFIGSSAESASYTKMLRRLFEEIKAHFAIDLAVPTSDSHLVRDVPLWLKMAGSKAPCLLVFDALNQLNDGTGSEGREHDLMWIPRVLPSGVRMLLSTLPGRAYDAVKNAGWVTMKVEPLQESEKMEIVTGYLEGIYGKTLSEDQKNMIVDAPQTNNALYLKALLDEVRMYGNFRMLTKKIQEYLTADNPGDLFAKILERLEQDFEKANESPDLVRHTTSAIWCSQKGMSEAELLELLQIPSAIWSPFYLSLIENIVNRNGIINFFHDHLRQAVESKYLPTDADKKKGYLWLADFFDNKQIDDRVADELPVLLQKAGELDRLHSTITNLEIFRRLACSEEGKFELIKAWTLLGDFSMVESAYRAELSKINKEDLGTDENLKLQKMLAEFYTDLGLYNAARAMFEQLLHQMESQNGASNSTLVYDSFSVSRRCKCNHENVIDLLHNLGEVCEKNKSLDDALVFYKDAVSRINKLNTPKHKLHLTSGLLGQATVLYLKDDMKEAKKFLIRARELATDVLGPRHHYVAAIINKLGQLSYKQGRLEEALGYFMQDLTLTRGEVGVGHPRTGAVLNDIALVYDDRSDPLAGGLYEAALSILKDTYGDNHVDVAVIRYNLGAYYFAINSWQRAKYQLMEAVKIYETFLGSDHADTKEAQSALTDIEAFAK